MRECYRALIPSFPTKNQGLVTLLKNLSCKYPRQTAHWAVAGQRQPPWTSLHESQAFGLRAWGLGLGAEGLGFRA